MSRAPTGVVVVLIAAERTSPLRCPRLATILRSLLPPVLRNWAAVLKMAPPGAIFVFRPSSSSDCALEVRVHETDRLRFIARHQVPVAIHRDRDRRVPQVGRKSLHIHAGRDEDARAGVASLVETEGLELRRLPRLLGSPDELVAVERPVTLSEEESAARPAQLVGCEVYAEGRDDRHLALVRTALRLNEAVGPVPRTLDSDDARLEVDVVELAEKFRRGPPKEKGRSKI
jgi:hypothetical protein